MFCQDKISWTTKMSCRKKFSWTKRFSRRKKILLTRRFSQWNLLVGWGGGGVEKITSRNSLGSQDFLTEILSYRGKMGLICVSGRKSLRPKEFLMARKSCWPEDFLMARKSRWPKDFLSEIFSWGGGEKKLPAEILLDQKIFSQMDEGNIIIQEKISWTKRISCHEKIL